MNIWNRATTPAGLLVAALASVVPAFGQMDLSGAWTPQFSEDQPERIPGPDLVDYLGIPINAGGPPVGFELGSGPSLAAGAPVPAAYRRLYLSRPAATPHLGGARPPNPGSGRDPQLHQYLRAEPDHLDGQPSASAGLRAPIP